MTTIAHASLTGSDLHEPKGAASASSGQVYVADGASSGSWTTPSLTPGDFNTGDIKATIKTTADTGFIMLDDGTIGNASSNATTRSNSDTEDLFTLIWNNIDESLCAVYDSSGVLTSKGASAAADYAANVAIATPKILGRLVAGAGSGSGLTTRALGEIAGEETHTLTSAEIPSHTHTGTTTTASAHTHGINDPGHNHTADVSTSYSDSSNPSGNVPGVTSTGTSYATSSHINATFYSGFINNHTTGISTQSGGSHNHTFTTSTVGSDGSHNIIQPTLFLNYMMKL